VKQVVGWWERVALPEWGIAGLRATIDTGARTSALDVKDIEDLPRGRVRFSVVVGTRPARLKTVEAFVVRTARVRSSSGVSQERHVVATTLALGGVARIVEVSLVSRSGMRHRMLVGRTALAGRFVVDPARADLTRQRR
jgi:hypothetical protein